MARWTTVLATLAIVTSPSLTGAAHAQRLSAAQQAEVNELVAAADTAMRGEFTPPADWLELQWHCLRGPRGAAYVPFTLAVHGEAAETLAPIAMYVRVARRGERTTAADYARRSLGPEPGQSLPVFSYDAAAAASANLRVMSEATKQKGPYVFQAVHFASLARGDRGEAFVQRALAAPPGSYDIYVVVRERGVPHEARPRWGVVKRVLDVPDFAGPALAISAPILAADIRAIRGPLTESQQSVHPYALGAFEIVPAGSPVFAATDELTAVVFVYNAAADRQGKPSVAAEYAIRFRELDGTLRPAARVHKERFDAGTLPKEFDYRRDGQLVTLHTVDMSGLASGWYHLEVTMVDERTSARSSSEVAFQVR
jgi:hypothetical protein